MIEIKLPAGARLIELGCGNRRHPAASVAVDCRYIEGATDFVVNFEEPNWPIGSDEFDAAYSCFVYEHISWRNSLNFLKECFRILKPGGKLVLITPDTEAQLKYLLKTEDWDNAGCMLFGDLDYPENSHKAFVNPAKLTQQLREVGFSQVLISPFGELQTDMITQAMKPLTPSEPVIKSSESIPTQGFLTNVLGSNVEPKPIAQEPEPAPELPPAAVLFDRRYWDGGNEYGGFQQGYRDFACLPAGELIVASTGLRDIETLKKGELVMTHKGRFRPIVEVMQRPYLGNILTIKPRYAPEFRLTPEHPVLVVDVVRKYGQGKPYVQGEPRWVEAKDIDLRKHWLVLPRPVKETQRKFTTDMMRLTGYYLSEGSVLDSKRGYGGVSFAFHRNETQYIEDVRDLMCKYYGVRGSVVYSRESKAAVVSCYAPNAKYEFAELGRDSYSKKISVEMMQADESVIVELLLGLFRGDGSLKDRHTLRYMTVSRSLASMVRLMLLRLGVVCALRWNPPPKKYSNIKGRPIKSKGYWNLCVSGRSFTKLAKLFGLGDGIEDRPWKKTTKEYDFCRIDDTNIYVPIRSIEENQYQGVVYNFEVEEDHSYLHPGAALHNCHTITAQHVLARKPESVLELGCARGYVLKQIQAAGIEAQGVDASKHCNLSKVCQYIIEADFAQHWGFAGGLRKFDLCFSIAVLDHIHESRLPFVIESMTKTCKRGLHGINFSPPGGDRTRQTCKPRDWWVALFEKHAPNWPVEILHKDELENGNLSPSFLAGDGKVKIQFGSFTTMFYNGWLNTDVVDLTQWAQQNLYKFKQLDVREGLPFDTESVDCIFTCHHMEHLTYAEGLAFLKECRRILKPDGAMRIIVPNAELRDESSYPDLEEFDELSGTVAAAKTQTRKLYELLHVNHFSMYDYETMAQQVSEAGLQPYRSWFCKQALTEGRGASNQATILRECLDALEPISLFVEAYVP